MAGTRLVGVRAASRTTACAVVAIVLGLGTAGAPGAAGAATRAAALGRVTAVNGSSTAGSCGTAGAAGAFSMATRSGARAVAVTATTTFYKPGVPGVSFANVCVGAVLGAVGSVADATLNARLILLAPPLPGVAIGMVTSVNGTSTAGTCGVAATAGAFTLATLTGPRSVSVTATTAFFKPPAPSASFANVCVGNLLGAIGTTSGATFNANKVLVWARTGLPPRGSFALGRVVSVNGATTAGACGTSGAAGAFDMATPWGARSVSVTDTTSFYKPGVSSPSFANVCVGNLAGAVGSTSGTTLNARLVVVAPPLPGATAGMVTSVNGSSTPGSCGSAGASGTFTLTTLTGSQAVAVTPTTAFFKPGSGSPSFASVCVNRLAGAVGTMSGGTLNATKVLVWAPGS